MGSSFRTRCSAADCPFTGECGSPLAFEPTARAHQCDALVHDDLADPEVVSDPGAGRFVLGEALVFEARAGCVSLFGLVHGCPYSGSQGVGRNGEWWDLREASGALDAC